MDAKELKKWASELPIRDTQIFFMKSHRHTHPISSAYLLAIQKKRRPNIPGKKPKTLPTQEIRNTYELDFYGRTRFK